MMYVRRPPYPIVFFKFLIFIFFSPKRCHIYKFILCLSEANKHCFLGRGASYTQFQTARHRQKQFDQINHRSLRSLLMVLKQKNILTMGNFRLYWNRVPDLPPPPPKDDMFFYSKNTYLRLNGDIPVGKIPIWIPPVS